jgi:hypothetical protein
VTRWEDIFLLSNLTEDIIGPIPSKICLNNKILERINEFNYLGYKLSFMGELDLPGKISKYSKTMGIINNVLKPSLVQKHTRIRI